MIMPQNSNGFHLLESRKIKKTIASAIYLYTVISMDNS